MHLIAVVLSFIGAAIIGVIGHVIAHDFCERAPTLARWLISFATKRLPPANRERYTEEWAAHLAECEGVLAKLGHAIGCLWCARRMRRQTYREIGLCVSFNLPGVGQAYMRTDFYEVGVLLWFYQLFARTNAPIIAYLVAVAVLFFRRLSFPERKGLTDKQIANFLKDTKRGDWMPTSINFTMQGESVELIGFLRACNKPEDYSTLAAATILYIRSRLDGTTC
jgi:hypothetical protein